MAIKKNPPRHIGEKISNNLVYIIFICSKTFITPTFYIYCCRSIKKFGKVVAVILVEFDLDYEYKFCQWWRLWNV